MIVRIKLVVTLSIAINSLAVLDASIKVVYGLVPVVTSPFAVGRVKVVDVALNCPPVSSCGIVIVVRTHLWKHTVDVEQFLNQLFWWWNRLR